MLGGAHVLTCLDGWIEMGKWEHTCWNGCNNEVGVTRVRLLTETLETQSSLRCGTWPQLMCCTIVAVQVPEVRRGQVGASEQGDSSDNDQDSEQGGGNKLEVLGTRGICPKQAGGCWTQ